MLRKILSFLSTRVGIALILAIIIVIGASIVKSGAWNTGSKKSGSALAVERIVKKSLQDDTDGDGLKNWEEALYKTDPGNPDTDGDGVNDGDEVAANRDPLVSGTGNNASSTKTSAASIQFNATDRFSQELFSKYIEAKQSGQEITQEFSDKVAEEILAKDYSAPEEVFDANTLSTIANPSLTQIHAYGNQFGAAIAIPVPNNTRSELAILDSIQSQGMTDEDAVELQKLFDRYSAIRNKLVSIKVPSEVRNVHATFIRSIDTVRDVVLGIQNLDTDPIGSLKKIALYEDGLNGLSVAAVSLKHYFVSKSVTFGAEESGSVILR